MTATQTPADRPPPPMGTMHRQRLFRARPHLGQLLHDLEADGALAGHDAGVVEGGHESHAMTGGQLVGASDALLVVRAHELDLGAIGAHAGDLDGRRVAGHDDDGAHAQEPRGPGDALGVIAAGVRDDARGALLRRELREGVVGAADLEGTDGLQVLRLEPDRWRAGRQPGARRPAAACAGPRRAVARRRPSRPRASPVGRQGGWARVRRSRRYTAATAVPMQPGPGGTGRLPRIQVVAGPSAAPRDTAPRRVHRS